MSTSVKFTFDTRFDGGAGDGVNPHAKKAMAPEEIEALKRDAREEGRRDGDVRANQAMAQSLSQIAAAMHTALKEIETVRGEAAGLALAAAKKIAGAALKAAPESEIAEALDAALYQAIGEPRLIVKTAPALIEKIEAKTAAMAAEHGFEGRIQCVPDPTLGAADCRIEWRGGGIERSHRLIESAIADLIERRFPGAVAPAQE